MLPANADRLAITTRVLEGGVGVKLDHLTLVAADVERAILTVTDPTAAASIRCEVTI